MTGLPPLPRVPVPTRAGGCSAGRLGARAPLPTPPRRPPGDLMSRVSTSTTPSRPRDADATRRALLSAARVLFSRDGYDATTVRAVAERAGVNQALLFRYFGNKEGLYLEAVRGRAMDVLTGGPRAELLTRIVTAVLAPTPNDSPEVFLAVLRGSRSTQVGERLRTELGAAYTAALADLVATGDRADAEARAELLLAWLLGISVVKSMPGAGASMTPETALPHVLRAATALLRG